MRGFRPNTVRLTETFGNGPQKAQTLTQKAQDFLCFLCFRFVHFVFLPVISIN
jgi:hypothetical protein